MSPVLSSIESITLDLPPSCIEFCPAYPEYFIVGTYNLEKDDQRAAGDLSRPQNRNGSLVIFRIHEKKMQILHTIPQPSAVLDLHFQPTENRQDQFAVASSTATLSIFRIHPLQSTGALLETVNIVRLSDIEKNVLLLACAWHPSLPDIVAVSTSIGKVYVVNTRQINPDGVAAQPVILHSLEAWTVVFQPTLKGQGYSREPKDDSSHQKIADDEDDTTATILYSGGDDSKLRYTLWTEGNHSSPRNSPLLHMTNLVFTISGHGAGVTAILPLPFETSNGERIVITGSYDDFIRVYLVRNPFNTADHIRQEKCLADQNLGGGVWRLKLMGNNHNDRDGSWKVRVLASCMHAGVRVIDISSDSNGACNISTVARFEEHESMNYGSDFQPGQSPFCVSSSFYDKRLCLWEVGIA